MVNAVMLGFLLFASTFAAFRFGRFYTFRTEPGFFFFGLGFNINTRPEEKSK